MKKKKDLSFGDLLVFVSSKCKTYENDYGQKGCDFPIV